jgi:hypothetical protein
MRRPRHSSSHFSPVRYEFPYVRFHNRYYPLIPITLKKGSKSVNTFALLDSGASISVFRPEIAKALNIQPNKNDVMRLGTANGGVDIDVVSVNVQVRETSFRAPVGFSSTEAAGFNILGREGFFYKFTIAFNEIMKTVIMVPLEKLP